MRFRKLLKKLATWHEKGQKTFNSTGVSRQLGISADHAYRDLWRLWRMGFLNRKKVKRKHHYYINKNGQGYIKYLHTFELNFNISSLESLNRLREWLLQQKELFLYVSDSLKTLSSFCYARHEFLYGSYKYFKNKRAREKFDELNEKILEELNFAWEVSLFHAKRQLRKDTKIHS